MIDKNALNWIDLGEGLEKLDIYRNKRNLIVFKFFKILLESNKFNLFFCSILQIISHIQLCCLFLENNDNVDYTNDYFVYIFKYLLKIFLPQTAITTYKAYKIIMILITILLLILLLCFFIVILNRNNDKRTSLIKLLILILNIFLKIFLNYLNGPLISISLISIYCRCGNNFILEDLCLIERKNFIYILLSLINLIFYIFFSFIFSLFYIEIGKIGKNNPKTQIYSNYELYNLFLKIIIFILYDIFNYFLEKKKIFIIIYNSILLLICLIFTYYIFKKTFFYDKIMNFIIHLSSFLISWFCLIVALKSIFNINKISIFAILGWIIIIISAITFFKNNTTKLILNTNIFELDKLKDIEMYNNSLLELIHSQNIDKSLILGFYYKFKEYLLSNQEMKEKYNFLSNSEYIKKFYNDKLILNGYYIIYLIYDYHLDKNKSNILLNIHFCYFLINYIKNIVSAIYQCAKIKCDSFKVYYYKGFPKKCAIFISYFILSISKFIKN